MLRDLISEHLRDKRERREFGSEIKGRFFDRDNVLRRDVDRAVGAVLGP